MVTLGLRLRRLGTDDVGRVEAGRKVFAALGCATCHTPEMPLLNTLFRGTLHSVAAANTTTPRSPKLDPADDPKRPFTFDLLQEAQPPRAEARAGGGANNPALR